MNNYTTITNDITVISLEGWLSAASAPEVQMSLSIIDDLMLPRVVLDLARVEFIDSSIIAVFVCALKQARQRDGDLRICGAVSGVRMIFTLTCLDRAFKLFPTLEDAVMAEW